MCVLRVNRSMAMASIRWWWYDSSSKSRRWNFNNLSTIVSSSISAVVVLRLVSLVVWLDRKCHHTFRRTFQTLRQLPWSLNNDISSFVVIDDDDDDDGIVVVSLMISISWKVLQVGNDCVCHDTIGTHSVMYWCIARALIWLNRSNTSVVALFWWLFSVGNTSCSIVPIISVPSCSRERRCGGIFCWGVRIEELRLCDVARKRRVDIILGSIRVGSISCTTRGWKMTKVTLVLVLAMASSGEINLALDLSSSESFSNVSTLDAASSRWFGWFSGWFFLSWWWTSTDVSVLGFVVTASAAATGGGVWTLAKSYSLRLWNSLLRLVVCSCNVVVVDVVVVAGCCSWRSGRGYGCMLLSVFVIW